MAQTQCIRSPGMRANLHANLHGAHAHRSPEDLHKLFTNNSDFNLESAVGQCGWSMRLRAEGTHPSSIEMSQSMLTNKVRYKSQHASSVRT